MLGFALTAIFMVAVAGDAYSRADEHLHRHALFLCALLFKGGAARRWRWGRMQKLPGLRIDPERVAEEFIPVLVTHDPRQLGRGIYAIEVNLT